MKICESETFWVESDFFTLKICLPGKLKYQRWSDCEIQYYSSVIIVSTLFARKTKYFMINTITRNINI